MVMAIALLVSISYLVGPLSSSEIETQALPAQPLPSETKRVRSYRQIEEHISQGGHRRIAIAVQDKAEFFPVVQAAVNRFDHVEELSLFYLFWNDNVDGAIVDGWAYETGTPLAAVMFEPNTTWTTGRNALARAIYKQVSLLASRQPLCMYIYCC